MSLYRRLIEKYLELHRKSALFRRVVFGLAALTVFVTVYQLIIPSITLTKRKARDMAGIRTEEKTVKVLDCGLKVHHHDKSCYKKIDGEKVLICGKTDYVIHEHDDSCYAADEKGKKTLVCELPEIKAHKHDDSCYEEETVLVCDKEEREGHEHTDECYEEEEKLVCDKEEHVHDEDCYEEVEDEDGNVTTELVCDKKEHEHDEDCYKTTRNLICDQEEEKGHTHSDKCYETKKVLVCGETAPHEHTKKCYEKGHDDDPEYLICEKLELKEHKHGKKCFVTLKTEEKSDDEKEDAKEEVKEKKEEEEKKDQDKEAALPAEGKEGKAKAQAPETDTVAAKEDDEEADADKDQNIQDADDEETEAAEVEEAVPEDEQEYDDTETEAAAIEGTDETSAETQIEDTDQEKEEETEQAGKEDAADDEQDDEDESSVRKIRFSRRLSDTTGIWRRFDDGSWARVKSTTILTRNENLMVRIAYVIPEGTLNEDNAYVEYKLPENLGATQLTADRINDDENHLNQIVEGSRLPNDEKSGDENLAGKYEMVYNGENENGEDTFRLELQFNDYTIKENASHDVEGWLMFYLKEIALPTDEDGNGKIVFSKKGADGEEVAVSYIVEKEDADEADQEEGEEAESQENETGEEETGETKSNIPLGITYPALSFSEKTDTVIVNVQAEEGALPFGTSMIVEDVQDENTLDSITEAAAGDGSSVEVKYIHAVDITFFDKTGREIEPLKPVRVSITYPETDESEGAVVMHMDKEGSVQTVDQVDKEELTETPAGNAVIFDAESFSIYAVVGTTLEKTILTSDGKNYKITVTCDSEAGIPKGAKLEASEITENTSYAGKEDHLSYDDYVSVTENVLGINRPASDVRLFDISIVDLDGKKIDLSAPVSVEISMIDRDNDLIDPQVVHFTDEKNAPEVVDNVDQDGTTVCFETDGFSVYAVAYTVDFHYVVNGKTYEFSIPGGGFVSFRKLVEELGIFGDISDEGNGTDIEEFIADVENLEFSDPDLVWIGKVYEETTVGSLKAQNNLACEYSAELTGEDIEKINSTKIQSDDWALIPRKPFKSEESLTVTMKNGEQFVIRVTDAQIQKTVITASGDTFKVTVTYDDTAEIPDGSELEADEILLGSEKYDELLGAASEALGTSAKNIEHIRFFDIKIKNGREIIEPENAVTVDIRYQEPVSCDESQDFNVIHFGNEGTDIYVPEYTVDEEKQTTREFSFQTESFSTFAITSIANTNNISQLIGNEYVLCVTNNGGEHAILSPEQYIATRNNRTYTNLKSIPVTVNGTRITADNVDTLPVWTITQGSTNNTYRLSTTYNNRTVYVNFGNQDNSDVTVSTNPQDLRILRRDGPNGGSQYRFAYNNNNQNPSLDLFYGETDQGFSVYSGNSNNNNEYFNLYTIGEVTPNKVTVHFVDRNGTPLTDVQYTGGSTYPPYLHRNDDGTFTINYDWNGTTGNVRLDTQFSKTRYTYANTHLAKNTTAEWPTVAHDHTSDGIIIEPTLTSTGHALQFNTDIGGSGSGEGQVSSHDFYEAFSAAPPNGDNREYAAEGDKDIYVIMDPIPAASGTGGSGGSGSDPFSNIDPVFHKDLANNHDGTYELSLSVVGKSLNESETPKVNVLLVVDTSSSMVKPDNDVDYKDDQGNTVHGHRLDATQVQLRKLGQQLLSRNIPNDEDKKDIVDLAMITFDGDPHPDTLDWTNSYNAFQTAVNSLSTHRGTDWEDALEAALTKANAMKAKQPNEPVYVLFFTDGEPSQYRSFHYTSYNSDYGWRYFFAQYGKEASKDEARAIVNNGIQLYTMFAFGPTAANQPTYYGDTQFQLLHKLVQYAYNTTDNLEDKRAFNATNSAVLESAFNAILHEIDSSLGITNVEMNDSFTDLTVAGINNVEVGMVGTGGFRYWTIPEGGTWENRVTWDDAPKAEIVNGGVKWDLGNKVLQNNVTYVLTFTVWPSQDAYDWVADLNNGVKNWDDVIDAGLDNQIYRVYNEDHTEVLGYEVQTNPQSKVDVDEDENITSVNGVSYKKTTEQTVTEPGTDAGTIKKWNDDHTAYIIETTSYTRNEDGTYTKKVESTVYTSFNMPDKRMMLEDTDFYVDKYWDINKKYVELHNFLYHEEQVDEQTVKWVSNEKQVHFKIMKGYDDTTGKPVPYDKYGTVGLPLGWQDALDDYDWTGETTTIEGHRIGTRWREKLDISFGLMLTQTQFEARGLDPNNTKYKSTVYKGVTYYLLDYGWDYAIDEITGLNYQFDYRTSVYHPMLIDGNPADVKFTVDEQTGVWTITDMTKDLTALTGSNILRGDLRLQKELLGIDGKKIEDENTTFDFTVILTNSEPVFIPDPDVETVPWYGVWKTTEGEDGHTVTQSYFYQYAPGGVFDHYATEEEATVPLPDGSRRLKDGYIGNVMQHGGTSATVTYNGTEYTGYTQASTTIHIKANEEWSIANIPLDTKVTLGESDKPGYEFVNAKINNNQVNVTMVDGKHTTPEYTIPAGTTTYIKITNQRHLDIEVLKVDANDLYTSNPNGLAGAVFELVKYTEADYRIPDSTWTVQTVTDENESGRFKFTNLSQGYYKLVETQVPDGHVKVEEDPIFKVTEDSGTITVTMLKMQNGTAIETSDQVSQIILSSSTFIVGNPPGVELPHTGGPGTMIFYLIGAIMMVFAGAGVMIKRRNYIS